MMQTATWLGDDNIALLRTRRNACEKRIQSLSSLRTLKTKCTADIAVTVLDPYDILASTDPIWEYARDHEVYRKHFVDIASAEESTC